MSESHQLQQDLQYVREVVARSEQKHRKPKAIYWTWALYVLITYPMNDFAAKYQNAFSTAGFFICCAATIYLGRQYGKTAGVKSGRGRPNLFWLGGATLIVLCIMALPAVLPGISRQAAGQLTVILVGIFYFLGGVHYDRNFLWLGPLLCVCGVLVGFVPHYGWTALGIIFALGLIGPTLFTPRPPTENLESTPA